MPDGWGVYALSCANLSVLVAIYSQLRTMNGRVARVEQQAADHNTSDNERHSGLTTEITRLRDTNHNLHTEVSTLKARVEMLRMGRASAR